MRSRFYPWPCSVGWGSGIAVSCGVGRKLGSNPTLLWMWLWPAATAPIQSLPWEPPYDRGVALKIQKKKTPKKTQENKTKHHTHKKMESEWKLLRQNV